MRYSHVGDDGIFAALDARGALRHRVVSEIEIRLAMRQAPTDTRAWRRGQAIAELASAGGIGRCDWTMVCDARRRLDLRDPFRTDVEWSPVPARGAEATSADRPAERTAGTVYANTAWRTTM